MATRMGHPSTREPTTASAANAMRMTFHMLAGYPVPPLVTIHNAAPGNRSGPAPLAPSVAG